MLSVWGAMQLRAIAILFATIIAASLAATLPPRPMLSAAVSHKRRSRKTVHLHDIARNDSKNEYFAGGQDEEGRGSATVLLYPDEPDANATETDEAEEEEVEEKPTAFSGTGRKL